MDDLLTDAEFYGMLLTFAGLALLAAVLAIAWPLGTGDDRP